MNGTRRIHWGRILLAGFLAEAALFALFLLLLLAATLAGVPELARPMSPLDYADALVFSFVMVFLFTLWVGKHIESGFVVHGVLIGSLAFCSSSSSFSPLPGRSRSRSCMWSRMS
jgi:hypothetical protein